MFITAIDALLAKVLDIHEQFFVGKKNEKLSYPPKTTSVEGRTRDL